MEKGSLRVDANISVHKEGDEWGTRCEIKNLNTVRGMMVALGEGSISFLRTCDLQVSPMRC
jgi:Asp-tRNA(Asn)/Glu-tRNA(Gln) amidotransferase B subunit